MFKTITTVVATLAVSGITCADDAVQWTEADGGNGHWYQFVEATGCITDDVLVAESYGGHLAAIASESEWGFISNHGIEFNAAPFRIGALGPALTGGQWEWVTGEQWEVEFWATADSSCPNTPYPNNGSQGQQVIAVGCGGGDLLEWDDFLACDNELTILIEYSADCNGDGIVDYGQILDGSLDDENGNGVPDCCDDATCLAPIPWKVEDGGNGNWYRFVKSEDLIAWDIAASNSVNYGGHLATITSSDENQFIVANFDGLGSGQAWIGLIQNTSSPDYAEPGGGWEWITQEPFGWSNWTPGEPNNSGKGNQSEEWGNIWFTGGDQPSYIGYWNDNVILDINRSDSYLIEWSADCNGDGIVDYGQILDGSLLDEDGNGIPDTCECVADVTDDGVVNITDLLIVIGAWDSDYLEADVTGDGEIGVADLLAVIDGWGFCP